jgi:hypothetical protein
MIDSLILLFALAVTVFGTWKFSQHYFAAEQHIDQTIRDWDVCREAERTEDY